ncbi:hypothetical protein BKA93DRAFT_761220 [Sparassis latifolia]|uniref:Zinc-type alcohol dehydrogenase-like protein n=1 Tax=Sparassis crispa TaxID=139825 RepID=A0A401GK12_9APHY|nr:Zinc-type alcohol dehydrogenase-like protein [Sparassis crispa]GBE82508.1 Zinc-type alcohol dehydrogenase-like protein [Sparassis crispa]
MSDIPHTQSAWRVMRQGEPSQVLRLDENVPVPIKLAKGEVLIKVQAAALNPIGYTMMQKIPSFIARVPYIPEHDFAGVVVDANGTELKNGDEVYGFLDVLLHFRTRQGTLAQYTRLPASSFAIRPQNITPTQAAGFGVVGVTAFQALFRVAKLEPEQSIFVNGGSTAVGAVAIQLAKAAGCKVTASASGKNEEYVRSLGADEFVDYTKGALHESLATLAPVPKYHLFLEAVGLGDPSLFIHSEAYLAPGGTFISVGPQPGSIQEFFSVVWNIFLKPRWLGGVKRKWKIVSVKNNQADLQKLTQYITEGKVKPIVDSVYGFQDVPKAYERMMTHRATGKIIVKVDPNVN